MTSLSASPLINFAAIIMLICFVISLVIGWKILKLLFIREPAYVRLILLWIIIFLFYFFQMKLDRQTGVHAAGCECVRGLSKCGHMVALLYQAKSNVSSTSMSCQWSKEKAPTDDKAWVCDLYKKENLSCHLTVISTAPSFKCWSRTWGTVQLRPALGFFSCLLRNQTNLLPSPRHTTFLMQKVSSVVRPMRILAQAF